MTSNEGNFNFVIPPLLPASFQEIQTTSESNTGKLIRRYMRKKYSRNTNEYEILTQNLDTLRDRLIKMSDQQKQEYELIADYNTLLFSITKDVDLSEKGAKVSYTWNNVTLPVPEFDMVCLLWNICCRQFKIINRISIESIEARQEVYSKICFAISFCQKIKSLFKNDFNQAVQLDKIDEMLSYLNAYHYQIVFLKSIHENVIKMKSKLAKSVSRAYSTLPSKNDEINNYKRLFEILAIAYGAEEYSLSKSDDKNKNTIAFLKCTFDEMEKLESQKKYLQTEFYKKYISQFNQLKAMYNFYRDNNTKIYHEVIPDLNYNFIQAQKIDIPNEKLFIWNSHIDISHIEKLAKTKSKVSETKTESNESILISTFQKEISLAIKDIEESQALYPLNLENNVLELLNSLKIQKETIHSAFVTIDDQITKFPQARQTLTNIYDEYQRLKENRIKADSIDQFYETKFYKAQNMLEIVRTRIGQLMEIKPRLQNILKQAETNFNNNATALDELGKQANQEFDRIVECMSEINETLYNNLESYKNEMEETRINIAKGLQCYYVWTNELQKISNTI